MAKRRPSDCDSSRVDRIFEELLDSIQKEGYVDWRDRTDETRTVQASDLNKILNGRGDVGVPPGVMNSDIEIRGVIVRGKVEVRNRKIKRKLMMRHCVFDEFMLDRVRLSCLDLEGSTITSLRCEHLIVRGDVLMRDCTVREGVWIAGARIKGMMSFTGAHLGRAGNLVALAADGVVVGRALHLDHGFHGVGEVQLRGAHIKTCLYCSAGRYEASRYGALTADGIIVDEEVFLNEGFWASGTVRLNNARIGRHLNCTDGVFEGSNGQGAALEVQYAQVSGDVYLNAFNASGGRFSATGMVDLNHAKIGQCVCCTGGVFNNPNDKAIILDGVSVLGDLVLGVVVRGEVSIAGSTVAGDVDCGGAQLRDPMPGDRRVAEVSLRLNDSQVDGYVRLGDGFTSYGAVVLDDARVKCGVDCSDGEFLARAGDMLLSARGMTVEHSFTWYPKKCCERGVVDLVGAQVGCLRDYSEVQEGDPWNLVSVRLRGFVFSHILNLGEARKRKQWVRSADAYTPEVYDQLAREYMAVGREGDAREIRYWSACEEHATLRHAHWPSWVWRWVPRLTVGYWHKPFRLFATLGVLLGLAWALFSWAGKNAIKPVVNGRDLSGFDPLAYSVDLLVPVIEIHQTEYYELKDKFSVLVIITWLLSLMGWVIVALVVERVAKPLFRK